MIKFEQITKKYMFTQFAIWRLEFQSIPKVVYSKVTVQILDKGNSL